MIKSIIESLPECVEEEKIEDEDVSRKFIKSLDCLLIILLGKILETPIKILRDDGSQ